LPPCAAGRADAFQGWSVSGTSRDLPLLVVARSITAPVRPDCGTDRFTTRPGCGTTTTSRTRSPRNSPQPTDVSRLVLRPPRRGPGKRVSDRLRHCDPFALPRVSKPSSEESFSSRSESGCQAPERYAALPCPQPSPPCAAG
jgi:hypothetical protein